MISAKVKFDLSRELAKAESIISSHLESQTKKALSDLIDQTPVETGEAREGWKIVAGPTKNAFSLVNSVEHLKYLNAGSSKQAPAHFIEATSLRYGKAVGNIVNYDK